jgi:hypothetical protein
MGSEPESSLPDRVLWTILLGVATAGAGLLAARAAGWTWAFLRGAAPPRPIGLLASWSQKAGASALLRRR